MTTALAQLSYDLFSIAVFSGVAGTPLLAHAVDETLPASGQSEALSHALKFGARAMQIANIRAQKSYQLLVERTQALGLRVSDRPTTKQAYEAWRAELHAALRETARKQSDAAPLVAFEAGTAVGDLQLGLGVMRHVIYLRTAAPELSPLEQAARALGAKLGAAQERLISSLPRLRLAASAGSLTQKLTTLLTPAKDFASATTVESFKAFGDWASAVSTALDELVAAFAAQTDSGS